jgi:pimeloyl-ACP methyl ester carboxylesterase
MTINSRGDTFANARALAGFIAYLHSHYGVSTARIVGHSFGGLWSRGALRLAAQSFPGVHVLSLTTLGTPHLGSFMADIAEGADPNLCGDTACRVIVALLIAAREVAFEPALGQLTAAALAQWNPGQGTSLKGIPVTAIAGDAVTFPGQTNRYVSPNDIAVGIESAQAVGLQQQGVIPTLSCFPPFPDVHSDTWLPFFPAVKHSLLSDPGVVTDVKQTLAGLPPSSSCPNPAAAFLSRAGDFSKGSLTVPLEVDVELRPGLLPRPGADDSIVVQRGTRITCRGHELRSIPFFEIPRLRVLRHPRCGAQLQVAPRRAGVLDLRQAPGRLTVKVRGRRISFQVRGLSTRAGDLAVALKHGHHYDRAQLDKSRSLLIRGHARTVTVRATVHQRGGSSAVAVVTVQLPPG